MFLNGVGIGIAVAITAAVPAAIRPVLRAGRTVCCGAVSGAVVPITAELRFGTTPTQAAAAAASVSGSAGQSCNFIGFLPFYLKNV